MIWIKKYFFVTLIYEKQKNQLTLFIALKTIVSNSSPKQASESLEKRMNDTMNNI